MKHLLCKIRGHQYAKKRSHGSGIEEYKCQCCKQKFTSDGYGNKVPLDEYWQSNNAFFVQLAKKC